MTPDQTAQHALITKRAHEIADLLATCALVRENDELLLREASDAMALGFELALRAVENRPCLKVV